MAQVTRLIPEEVALLQIEGETSPVEPMKDHIQVLQVLFPRLGVDNDVVQVHEVELTIRLYEGASFSPDRLHNRPEAARYLLTLVTACSDRDAHTLSKFS
jgi:hypothetical protein